MSAPLLTWQEVVGQGAAPTRAALVLHGILGHGANWRSFVRRLALTPEAAGWRFVMPDLRGHGDSPRSTFGAAAAGPDTVASCAADLFELGTQLGVTFEWVLGHSFGGKVACAFAAGRPESVRSLWLLDTPPGSVELDARQAGEDSVVKVLRVLEMLGTTLPPRDAVVSRLVELGLSLPIAQWLGTNVRRDDEGCWGWRFAVPVIRDLLDDFARLDCTAALQSLAAAGVHTHLVRGGRSDRFDPATTAALAGIHGLREAVLPQAGHWLHVDDPDGLFALLHAELARLAS
jgi:pimeloyl-ACP methyl ester carboxylesterase